MDSYLEGGYFKIFFFFSKILKKQPLPVSAYKIQVNWARRESKQFLDIIRVLTCVTFSAENSELL